MDEKIILDIATLLGGITALWFLYGKRSILFSWLNGSKREPLNPLSLPDVSFEFICNNAALLKNGFYAPVDAHEKELCLIQVNHGVLRNKGGTFNLTQSGKAMLVKKRGGVISEVQQPAFAPQPKCLVKPTPTSSACGCPPYFVLRRGLPRALHDRFTD